MSNLILSVDWANENQTASMAADWFQRFNIDFFVKTTDRRVGPLTVRTAQDPNTGLTIPGIGSSYSYLPGTPFAEANPKAFVQSVASARKDANGQDWTVTVEYGPYDATTFGADPLEWPLQLRWSGENYDQVVYADVNGKAIVNSAGDPFDEPLTISSRRPTLEITRNEASYAPSLAYANVDYVNSDTWLGAAPGNVKVSFVPGELKFSPEVGWYYVVAYQFQFDPNGWTRQVLDRGFAVLDTTKSPPVPKPITNEGQPLSEPILLDGNGNRLASGGTPAFLEFTVYNSISFANTFGFDFTGVPGLGS